MIEDSKFLDIIEKYRSSGRYRIFNEISRKKGEFPKSLWYNREKSSYEEVVNWCSNDYLGMGQNSHVLDAMHRALDEVGAGSGGTRNISGNTSYHSSLEKELADLHKKNNALLYTSAYVANEWSLISLSKIITDIVFLSDSKNHSSLIQGVKYSGAEKIIWQHNDISDLAKKLKDVYYQRKTPCIVFQSVHSMDGDISPIEDICELARTYKAITYIDEVHAVGLYGKNGAGYLEKLGLQREVDIVNGTLGKAFGLSGGYITANDPIIDAIRLISSGFIFTTSISPVICAGAIASIKYLRQHDELRHTHQKNAMKLKSKFISAGLEVHPNSRSHIVPVMIRNSDTCKKISDILLNDCAIYVQPINWPTVQEGEERLRFAPTPMHTDEMIDDCVESLKYVYRKIYP
jgi:5-aminolevulinate synthase